ncbi:H-NS histone family protein [Massilia sp. YIM B04103]|uniref:H-NS histone family protein n=1 Tax=Massilia sp. YIM B04103 TaxID=2963106 RepID=UPI00210AE26C|nr:H-NS histone family protein [Massilia sp. YIM B04103]
MHSYQHYQDEIAQLQRLADTARHQEITSARDTIFAIMRQYGLSAADLGVPAPRRATSGQRLAPKYRNTTGDTWCGLGRMPKWLVGKNCADYLVK